MVLAGVGVWVVGYQAGQRVAREQLRPWVEPGPAVNDPLGQSVPYNPGLLGPSSAEAASAPVNPDRVGPSRNTGQILTSTGPRATDPRLPGHNYLALANLPEDQARGAIEFFARQGIELVAVPLAGRNNPREYRLYSLALAVPSAEYSRSRPQREAHQAQIARLGAIWQRQYRGGSDFSRTVWERYDG